MIESKLLGCCPPRWSAATLTASTSIACLLWSSAALAQTAAGAGGTQASANSTSLEEVVVTAQRRSEVAQRVPIAVAVMSATNVQAMGATDTNSLSGKIPSLTVAPAGSQLFFLRGIGTTGTSTNIEPSVSTYIDGVYIYGNFTSGVPLTGADHVEVLKGPQGTLFGRNTTGGVIQIVTRDPLAAPALELSGGYGDYDVHTATAYA